MREGERAGGPLERPRVRGRRLPDPRVLVHGGLKSGVPLHGEVTNTRSTVPYLESGGLEPHAWGAPYLDYQALQGTAVPCILVLRRCEYRFTRFRHRLWDLVRFEVLTVPVIY